MRAATKTSAAQWCTWRMSRPARTFQLRSSDGAVGVGHRHAVQRLVAAVVDHERLGGVEEERQEDAGHDQHDEAVERDLAEEERPAVGEDVTQFLAQDAAAAEVAVEPARGAAGGRWRDAERPPEALLEAVLAHPSFQKPGPMGTGEVALGHEAALRVDGQRELRQRARRPGRPTGCAPSIRSKVDWWHGHTSTWASSSYWATGQPACVQTRE